MKTVLCNGCFDGLHIGHLMHLMQAAAMGDRLVVSITNDETVKKEKGWFRPVFGQEQRSEMLKQLRFVDDVVIVRSAHEALQSVAPNIFVKGPDYTIAKIDDDISMLCSRNRIEIRFTEGPKFSSTALLSQMFK